MKDSHTRSVVKGITWRIIAASTTMAVVYILTGDLALMAGVGVIESSLKIGFYYAHERAWGKVAWGLVKGAPVSRK